MGVQGRSRSSMLVPPESSSAVLVTIRSKSVSICNHSRARLVDSSRNRTFSRGTQIWCARTEDSLNVGGQTLHRWNIRLTPNISCAGCLGLSWMVSGQFTLKVFILQFKIAKNSLKPPILGVQGRSMSSMLVPLESGSAVLVMISKSVSICNRFHARWANSGKIMISKGGWCPRSRGISYPVAPNYLIRNYRL